MKSLFKIVFVIAVMVSINSMAANLTPCDSREAALLGATHVLRIGLSDLASSTSTNTALVLVNNIISAKEQLECVNMVLDQAFDTGNTNDTGSVALKVGDSTDDDLYLTSTELASDGSEVFLKYGRADVPSVTVASNFVATVTAGVTGKKIYTAANYIKVTLTPNAEEALSANTKGAVSIYFRKTGK
jgi:hypothetical protein